MRALPPFLLLLSLTLAPGLAGADGLGDLTDRAISGAKEASKDMADAAAEGAAEGAADAAGEEAREKGDAAGRSLTETLVSSLDVTPEQATGGSGAIFDLARQRMDPADFARVADTVPEMDTLLAAAPGVDVAAAPPESAEKSLLGSAASALGGSSDLGAAAALVEPFSKLGLSPQMVSQFIPQVLSYVESRGGAAVSALLKAALL